MCYRLSFAFFFNLSEVVVVRGMVYPQAAVPLRGSLPGVVYLKLLRSFLLLSEPFNEIMLQLWLRSFLLLSEPFNVIMLLLWLRHHELLL